jgi:hypothetical protein
MDIMAPSTDNNDFNTDAIDPAIAERVLQKIKDVAQGNVANPSLISYDNLLGQVYDFEGLNYFTIIPDIIEKRSVGKLNGAILGSASEMRARLNDFPKQAALDYSIIQLVIGKLHSKADLGVFKNQEAFPLETMQQQYVVHEACGTCSHLGYLTCPQCSGVGRVSCHKCHGTKNMVCMQCRGSKIQPKSNNRAPCMKCIGRGVTGCTLCRQAGLETCRKCRQRGNLPCGHCNGSGWHSLIGQVNIKVSSRFDYDRSSLPEEFTARIDKDGEAMAKRKDIEVAMITNQRRIQELSNIAKPAEFIVPYHLRMMVGAVDIKISEEQKFTVKFIGQRPDIYEAPAFLEVPLRRNFAALKAAQEGDENALKEALKARFINEAMISLMRHTPQKALALLQKRYPVGLSDKRIKHTLHMLDQITSKLAKGPSRKAFALSGLLAAMVYSAYFILPVRRLTSDYLGAMPQGQIMTGLLDLMVYIAGLYAATICAHMMVGHHVKQILGQLSDHVPEGKVGQPIRKYFGKTFLMVTPIYFLAIEIIHMIGGDRPLWLETLLLNIKNMI